MYYNCGRRYRTQGSECANSANVMELDVERRLVSVLSDLIDREAARLETEIREQKRKAESSDSKKQREAIERKRRRAWEAYLDEIISKEEFKQTAIRLDAQLAALPAAPVIDEDAPRKMRQAMPDGWRALYFELDCAHKKQFWAGILERIEILPDRDLRVVLRGSGAESAFNTRIQQPDGYWVEIIKAKE